MSDAFHTDFTQEQWHILSEMLLQLQSHMF